MTQNLDLDLISDPDHPLTPADTDIKADWVPSASTRISSDLNWSGSNIEPESYDPGDIYWNGVLNDEWEEDYSPYISSTGDSHYRLGNYYNWTAAVALNNSSNYVINTIVDQSICPAGWTLPRAGYGEDSFYHLFASYSFYDHSIVDDVAMWNEPMYLALTGAVYSYHYGTTAYDNIGADGQYWSSVAGEPSQYQPYKAFQTYIDFEGANDTSVWSSTNVARENGLAVRCIARPVTSTIVLTEP